MAAGNGWAEYQRLVLAELERYNQWMTLLDQKLSTMSTQNQLLQRQVELMEKNIEHNNEKLEKLQAGAATSEAISQYRKYVVGLAIALFDSVLIPLVKLMVG